MRFTLVDEVIILAERLARGEFDGPEQRLKIGLVVRSWPLPPYRLFYRRRDGVLEVMRIYHHARRPITR
ncbi:MAG: type II toxin-antitoxin system RelE/ParE family toxin [Deltaproteobacteria bacterium]|nr:type II toxin-antitoxin system RelE/ParE family toxin [Deltaproteobacteria bacterium]